MNREETRADNEMRQRWIDGEIAQFYTSMDTWEDCPEQDNVGWNNNYTHRIKPKPTTRPWTMAECPLQVTVRCKLTGNKFTLTYTNKERALLENACLRAHPTYRELRDDYVLVRSAEDESICGIIESTE